MTTDKPRRPLPHEFTEVAKGSGAAAILLFLQIAATGYLSYIIYFLLTGNTEVFWNLLPMKAAALFYFPASFAVLTALPTDKLTRIVCRVAMAAGIIATIIYGAGMIVQYLTSKDSALQPNLETLLAVATGLAAGLFFRGIFHVALSTRRAEFQKNIR